MELPDDATSQVLERWPVATLCTLAGSGRPHAVPIVFARAGGAIWSPIDGKPKRGGELARLRHIRRDSRVSLLCSNYHDDWTLLWWLRIDGNAQIRRAPTGAVGEEESAALAALRRKYPQYERTALLGPDAQLLRIGVTGQRSWCASAAGSEALLAYIPPGAGRVL